MMMSKRINTLILVATIFIGGCAPVLIGAGAIGAYALSNDSAKGNIETSYNTLWNLSHNTVKKMGGSVTLIKESSGIIKALISGYSVTIRINSLSSSTQELKVSARKNFIPKPYFAQKVFMEIIKRFK